TLSYALEVADKGWQRALHENVALQRGANISEGQVTHAGVAEAFGLEHTPIRSLLWRYAPPTSARAFRCDPPGTPLAACALRHFDRTATHREHWTTGVAHALLRHAAHEEVCQAAASVCGDHDEVGTYALCRVGNDLSRRTRLDHAAHALFFFLEIRDQA